MASQPTIPQSFFTQVATQFHDRLRIRWSAATNTWQVEQRVGRAVLAPREVDPDNDRLVRARDGFTHVMTVQAAPRAPCPKCHATLPVPALKTAEVVCASCTRAGRDGRYALGYWPLGDLLLSHLHRISPEHNGHLNALREQDLTHERRLLGLERDTRNAMHAGMSEDIRRVLGIPMTGYTGRVFAPETP